ncbi:Asp-tRNA(Asn)/Glu-tRNA(Gln) amidotransferase subunit GatC [candidate division KSB1 bacterium]|nr:Asp-tRNA(Asn)/Glu-tRNA(Gln) amidotransferase subunit GatC [candidate division KSB1 bacterium]
MAITKSDVERIAKLAKLDFSDEEKMNFTHQLSEILGYMEKLNELDTEEIEPTSHVLGIQNELREDRQESWVSQEEALKNAPKQKKGFFSVPKVIAHES